MSFRSFVARTAIKAASVAALAWSGASATAADVTPPPVVSPAPVYVGAPVGGCETCQQQGVPVGSCSTCSKHGKPVCGKGLFGHKPQTPYQVNLCPGACFGYFQTQWRKWDEVCPYPYQGTGLSDAPPRPAGVLNPRTPGSGELNPPRPLDPKMADPKKVGTLALPPIPEVPSKFGR